MNKSHEQFLSSFAKTNGFLSLISLRDALVKNWNDQKGTGDTEFQYLKSCLLRDGKIEGVNALIQSIEQFALNSKKE